MPTSATGSRRAPELLFGISFQANAGIMIMLRNIRAMRSIRLEGAKEDIELTLEDGSKICAQAKSVVRANSDFRNILAYFDSALTSLSEAEAHYQEKVKALIYVTNSIKPIGASEIQVHGETYLSFNDLTEKAQKKIIARIRKERVSLSVNKLWIYHLPFCGDDLQERHKCISESISNFLGRIVGASGQGIPDRLMKIWQTDIFDSGTIQEGVIELSKEDIFWPLVLLKLDATFDGGYYQNFDPADLNELENRYCELLSYKVQHWATITKILCDFDEYPTMRGVTSRDKMFRFIDEKWGCYVDEIEDLIDEDGLKEVFLKIMLYRVLVWKSTIKNIKDAVNI